MIHPWIAVALLAGSWLLGLDYFYPANPYAWLAALAAAVVLLGRSDGVALPTMRWPWRAAAVALLLPAAWQCDWPYRAAPLLVALGLAIPPRKDRRLDRLAAGAAAAGVILFVQALALEVYAAHTARSHDLPRPLVELLAGIARLLGMDAAADGGAVVLYSMRQTHRLAATWEWLLDPATMLFYFGAAAMLALQATRGNRSDLRNGDCSDFRDGDCPDFRASENGTVPFGKPNPWQTWIGRLRTLTLVVAAWIPLRAGLLAALYLHRVLRSDPDRPLHAMNHFFSPWMLLGLLVVPALLAWRFVRGPAAGGPWHGDGGQAVEVRGPRKAASVLSESPQIPIPEIPHPLSRILLPGSLSLLLFALAVALFTAAIYWCPSGARKQGRVMVVERHSHWEPTTKPYDTKWFVEPEPFPDVNSGYNYARIYRYLEQYYTMSRLLENDAIDDAALDGCDVLIVKTPTERYAPREAAAVARFVERGGGLLLIGDHTNYERSSTILNDITRPMGFIFRDDLLFGFGASPYEQYYIPPAAPHPIVQHVPPMDFAVSCSIDPGTSAGRAAVVNTGLWSMGPEYHNDNFHPVPQHCPAMRYGAFIQIWAARHGRGRAVAFTDSTIFSNFCVGQPGKSEIMLGMVEWLNHAEPWLDPRPWLVLLGLLSLGAAGASAARAVARNAFVPWVLFFAVGACAWALASMASAAANRWNLPEPERLRPERRVVIDRETSVVPLSKGPYTEGEGRGYGLLEQWLARLDCHTVRKTGDALFSGDVLAVVCPSRSVPDAYREKVEAFVAAGGKLLVLDSPENVNSTANSVLWPFGLSIHHDRAWKGRLTTALKLPEIEVAEAREVVGGRPVARLGRLPVAAFVRHGRGAVLAVGFGSVWNDARMGETWMIEPDAATKARFDVLFGLVRPFFEDKPWPDFPPLPEVPKTEDAKDVPLTESGPAEL